MSLGEFILKKLEEIPVCQCQLIERRRCSK